MEGIFIISDYKEGIKEIIKQIGIPQNQVISFPAIENESSWHDWTTQIFRDNNIKKLVIPVSVSVQPDNIINTQGLMTSLQIRLNYELKKEQRLTPIILLSDFSLDVLLRKNFFDPDNNPQNLLFTKGVILSAFDKDEILKSIEKINHCYPGEYKKAVLDKLKILQKASIGKHSIANAWGCFKLALVTGLRDEIFQIEAVSRMLKTLYAKYLICYNEAYTAEKYIDLNTLKCSGKKILFIDDQADEGWTQIMTQIFKTAGNNFVSVDSLKYKNKETKQFHDFDGFYNECLSHIGKGWDLIIVDLRLHPEIEDIDNEMISPTKFSGYKLIDDFLSRNEGYQIIVLTASNKIWNISAALKRGASSYYIKESPEFNYSINETQKQFEEFKNDVHCCFDERYLRFIYQDIPKTISKWEKVKLPAKKNIADMHDGLLHIQTPSLINSFLKSSFATLCNKKIDERFTLSVLQLFRVLEIVCEYYIIETGTSREKNLKFRFDDDSKLLNFWKGSQSVYKDGDPIPRIQQTLNVYFKRTNKINQSLFDNLIALNEYRNRVAIHPSQRAKEESLEYLFEFNNKKFQKDIDNYFMAVIDFLNSI